MLNAGHVETQYFASYYLQKLHNKSEFPGQAYNKNHYIYILLRIEKSQNIASLPITFT
jgi:hypothetical protein